MTSTNTEGSYHNGSPPPEDRKGNRESKYESPVYAAAISES